MTDKEWKNLLLFAFVATFITALADVVVVKRYNFVNYVLLNMLEWSMFGSGFIAGNYFTLKKIRRINNGRTNRRTNSGQ